MKSLFFVFFLVVTAQAMKDLGVHGQLYPILERSYMDELEEKSKNVDWEKQQDNFKKSFKKSFIAKSGLPKCQITKVRRFYKMYTVKYPLGTEEHLEIPAGTTFNVIAKMREKGITTSDTYLFVDINDGLHFEYAKLRDKESSVYVMALDGDIEEAAKKGFQVEKGDGLVKEFEIKCTPSIYTMKDDHFEVLEIDNNELLSKIKKMKEK